MIRLTEQEEKAISSLKMNPSFQKIKDMLIKEYDVSITNLLRAKDNNFHSIQGRAILLDELNTLLK